MDKEESIVEALYHINKLEKNLRSLYTDIDERLELKVALKKYKSSLKRSLGVKGQ